MPLSPTVEREHLHTRQVECRGYRRADGLWDIEGHLRDYKNRAWRVEGRELAVGEPVHDMWLRFTVDSDFLIRDVEAVMDGAPHGMCPLIAPNFKKLIGIHIKHGFTQKVRDLLGGIEGCTHLVELTGPVATTAFQTIGFAALNGENPASDVQPTKKPALLNSCHSYASDSEVVKKRWPAYYTGK